MSIIHQGTSNLLSDGVFDVTVTVNWKFSGALTVIVPPYSIGVTVSVGGELLCTLVQSGCDVAGVRGS
jgi:hypothetical protein